MAADPTNNETSPVSYKEAVKDYSLMITMLKWGAVLALIVAFLVLIIIAN